jgi:hypothetical protein
MDSVLKNNQPTWNVIYQAGYRVKNMATAYSATQITPWC